MAGLVIVPRSGTSTRFDDDRRAMGAARAAAPGGGDHRRRARAGRVVGPAPGRDLLPGQRRDRLAGPCRPTSHRTRPSRPCSAGGLGRGRLHSAERARLADGRGPVPTAAVIDSRPSAPPTRSRPPAAGTTAGKKIKSRKRHVAVDLGGLLLAVAVRTVSLQDRDRAFRITAALREAFSTIPPPRARL
jgi:hypothetical protein